jgi:hypothetical protein
MIKTPTNIIKNVLLIILYLIISVIVFTIIINQDSIHCDSGLSIELKPISWYDIHQIPVSKLGKGWESQIIIPELGKIKYAGLDMSDKLFQSVYSEQTRICDLQLEFSYKNKGTKSIQLRDYWPMPNSKGHWIKLPIKSEFLQNHTLVIDFKPGKEIKEWACECNNK